MTARLLVVAIAGVTAIAGGCGADGPTLLPAAENTALHEAFNALKVTTYRMGRPDSPLIYGCTAVRKNLTPERKEAVATIIRIADTYPGTWSANSDFADVPPEPVLGRVSQRAEILRECLNRVGVPGEGWARAAAALERAAKK